MKKALNTRRTILEKAFNLIYKKGYQTTSIDEIIAARKCFTYGSTLILLEASRRLDNSFTLKIEARLFPFLAEEEVVFGEG